MKTRRYKNIKGLKRENLRDNMSTPELAFNMLAQVVNTNSYRQIAGSTDELKKVAERILRLHFLP